MDVEVSDIQEAYENAVNLASQDKVLANTRFRDIIFGTWEQSVLGDSVKFQELSIYGLASIYVEQKKGEDIVKLIAELHPVFALMAKAKTAKIVRTLIDYLAKIPNTLSLQIKACKDCIAWSEQGKRSFLKHRVQTRLAALYLEEKRYTEALHILTDLLREIKKLDDKLLLVEIYVTETKGNFAVLNLPKAKASLTSAKTNANAIHCPPLLQAEIDLLSGIINAHEGDFSTSYSYFFEAFEAFSLAGDPRATPSIRYMILAKIMANSSADITSICNTKNGMKYSSDHGVEALVEVAKAHKNSSLAAFENVVDRYKKILLSDSIIEFHIKNLNDTLLTQNLLKLIDPYDRVEVARIAELINLPEVRVQTKLSEMILDGKLSGTLDQGVGVLIVFENPCLPTTYGNFLETVANMSTALDTLYKKASLLAA